jgi:DNA (cytosine-5)-methyltransferase 1
MLERFSDGGDLKALELFCGMGGLSSGFARTGFKVTGVDISEKVGRTFSSNKFGTFVKKDLMRSGIRGRFDVVIGGPPCEPWSSLNLTRRGDKHPLYGCLDAFFREVLKLKPDAFVMENVPALQKDSSFLMNLKAVGKRYDTIARTFRYSDYGAAFARRRLFVVGIKKKAGRSASEVVDSMRKEKSMTVRQKIEDLRYKNPDPAIDHVWPNLKTIHKYLNYYRSGKYGWYILDWDSPSPSFGNITKTYILHPDSFKNGNGARPISVREALRIIGFEDECRFPIGLDMKAKYEMLAAAVSPVFSLKLATALKELLLGLSNR